MIRINSYIHRDDFCNLIRRWMYGQMYRSDAELITGLVHFNNVFVSRYLNLFSETILQRLHGGHFITRDSLTKGDLKDVIVTHPPYLNSRIEELILTYKKFPERFYRETPFHGTLFFVNQNGGELYVASNRIKRVRRLAEKSARRIIDHLFLAIKKDADNMADERARQLGIDRKFLITRPEDMRDEFVKAENRLLEDLRNQRPIQFEHDLVVNDVAGIKIIVESSQYKMVRNILQDLPNCEVIEEEPHMGNYNAVNLILRYEPPKEKLLQQPLGEKILHLIRNRGLEKELANREFANFVYSGEKHVHIEIIVSSYQEMLESEIGRCMHEDRINEQRLKQEYRGHLARNIEYLMVFMFSCAYSRHVEIEQLPIKLWHRYLPDYFDEVTRSLFDLPPLRMVESS